MVELFTLSDLRLDVEIECTYSECPFEEDLCRTLPRAPELSLDSRMSADPDVQIGSSAYDHHDTEHMNLTWNAMICASLAKDLFILMY